MKRTNISLTDEQYEYLKQRSYDLGLSMSGIVRFMVEEAPGFSNKPPEKKPQKAVPLKIDPPDEIEVEAVNMLAPEPMQLNCKHDKPKNLCKQCIEGK